MLTSGAGFGGWIKGGDFLEGSLILRCFQKCFGIWGWGGVSSVWNLGIYGLEMGGWKLEYSKVRSEKLGVRMF